MKSETLFKNALAFFPKWMNINRRPYESTQGRILSSILSEFDEIEKSLEEYRKEFFLINYLDKENDVLNILYAAHIGSVDIKKIIIESPAGFVLTGDINTFKDIVKSIYYQDGYLLIRERYIGSGTVTYSLNGGTFGAKWVKMSVWNVFDEFAWFAGLERSVGESNKDLSNRVLAAFKNRTNVTRAGLKNAVRNYLLKYGDSRPEILAPNEILFALPDDEYGNVFERIAYLNQDLARTKQWDVSYWENGFAKLEYLPHVWDTPVSIYKNGVGYRDSLLLRTNESSNVNYTDVVVTGYNRSVKQINTYVQQNNIRKPIPLTLKRYKNILTPVRVPYKVTATSIDKLDTHNIYINAYRTVSGRATFPLEQIATGTQGVKISKRGYAEPGNYKLIFKPTRPVGAMEVSRAKFGDKDLLVEDGAFVKVGDVIRNRDVKFFTDSILNCNATSNLVDTPSGIGVDDLSKEGTFSVDVSGMRSQYVHIKHDCVMTNIAAASPFISASGFKLSGAEWSDESSSTVSTLTIKLSCTAISFSLFKNDDPTKQGSIKFTVTVDGNIDGDLETEWDAPSRYYKKFDTLRNVEIVIHKHGQNPVTIGDINASRYKFSLTTDKGSLFQTPMGYIIPPIANSLIGTIQSYDGQTPFMEYIHIGSLLTNAVYTIDNIKIDKAGYFSISTDLDVTLVNKDTNEETPHFQTTDVYTATEETGFVFLNVSRFTEIRSSDPKIYTDASRSYVALNKDESCSTVTIYGTENQLLTTKKLSDLLPSGTAYANRDSDSILVVNGSAKKEFISRSVFPEAANRIVVTGYKTGSAVFVLNTAGNTMIADTIVSSAWVKMYFTPFKTDEYISNGSITMLTPELVNIDMPFSFSPVLSPETLVYYRIESPPAKVEFSWNGSCIDWFFAAGHTPKLCCTLPRDTYNTENYQVETLSFENSFLLLNTIPLNDVYNINNESVELARYIIVPPNTMRVDYAERNVIEDVIVTNDMFNKLTYSNVISIVSIQESGNDIAAESYTLLKEGGIIAWSDESLKAKMVRVTYTYKKPVSLSFKSLTDLYKLVGYVADTYDTAFVKTFKRVTEGQIVSLPKADRYVATVGDPSFAPLIKGNTVSIYRINDKKYVAVHNGYFYDDGKEYWYFANRTEEVAEKFDGVDMRRVEKLNGELRLWQKSTNFIPNSTMSGGQNGVLCILDFKDNNHLPVVSTLNALSACDSFAGWYINDTDILLVESGDQMALSFNGRGYAILDITRALSKQNNTVYINKAGNLRAFLAEDITVNDNHLRKAPFVTPVAEILNDGYTVTYRRKHAYYVIVIGEGTLTGIITKHKEDSDSFERNIDKFGLSNIKEKRVKNSVFNLAFDPLMARCDGLEFDRKGTLRIGTDIDYGATLISDVDLSRCKYDSGFRYIDGKSPRLETDDVQGVVTSPTIQLNEKAGIGILDAVVNTAMLDSRYENFTIEVLTANRSSGPFIVVETKTDTNVISTDRRNLGTYVRIRVTAPANKIIDRLCVFAEYNTAGDAPHVHLNESGTCVSKAMDTGVAGDYKISRVLFKQKHGVVSLQVRALRETVWTPWTNVPFDTDGTVTKDIPLRGYRVFQARVTMSGENPLFDFTGLELAVM